MSDLISRKALLKALGKSVGNNGNTIKIDIMDVKSLIKEQPVAYDVDKVVEDMEFDKGMVEGVKIIEREKKLVDITWQRAIEIVKGGGVDE